MRRYLHIVVVLAFMLWNASVDCVVAQREEPISLTTSLIIPCDGKHGFYLPTLLDWYTKQTVLPNEVVISLSRSEMVPFKVIKDLNSKRWPFPVHVLYHTEKITAAGNRNLASKKAAGQILIYQDADDLPHPQRIEIIKFFFENFSLDHLMHDYVISRIINNVKVREGSNGKKENTLPLITEQEQLKWFVPENHTPGLGANNAIAITKRVFNVVQWDADCTHGEDSKFNQNVYAKFPNRIVLQNRLYEYFIR